MKCKACNGTGYVTACVYESDEIGFVDKNYECAVCHGTGQIEKTNEEWFCQLSTEEKAKVLRRRTYGNGEENESVEQSWVNWLKATHEDNPPDIPSVPSWDKWLEGERTKCTYCDGNGVECDLYGRSECPKTPKTEQEYIQTCTTEQLAEEIYEYAMTPHWQISKEAILEWLKQPHKPIS